MNNISARKYLGLRIIGILKLISAALLIAVGLGIFHILGGDVGQSLEIFIRQLRLDPDNKHFTRVLADISGISHRQLEAIDAVAFLYAILYITEGIGLLLARHWAEYLTIFATSTLIPVEIFELVKKTTEPRVAVFIINVAIVVTLIYQLRNEQKRLNALRALLAADPEGIH